MPGVNRLLTALSTVDFERLTRRAQRLEVEPGHVLHEPNQPIRDVYFPTRGLVSIVVTSSDGLTVEAGVIGNEGLVGLAHFLGADSSPTKAFFQSPGECLRLKASHFSEEVERSRTLERLVRRFTQSMLNQLSQSVACNRRHSVQERMARWLLMSQDRIGSDELQVTQDVLAQMLGVRRPSVTVTAGVLQQAGLIRYGRGRITVLDRRRLEAASCECYGVVRGELRRLLGS